jgi:oligopeptide/dipeptide ABC transporter ATP-binding protein
VGCAPDKPLLQVTDLSVRYAAGGQQHPVLDGIRFEMRPGEVVGMLGESGAGKTTLALALLGLLPDCACILQGSIHFGGRDMLTLDASELERIRGAEVSMIFQEPQLALNPVMRAIDQVTEVIAAHHNRSRRRCQEVARQVMVEVGLVSSTLSAYPHELSGGQRQRLVIAQALACRPALLIADEPTASLDSTLRLQWLSLMKHLRDHLSLALLLITHDPDILTGLADRVLVLYGGRIVEEASAEELVRCPLHPYTAALFRSKPPWPGQARMASKCLPTIPGSSEPGAAAAPGCPFEPRCCDRFAACTQRDPSDTWTADGHWVRCLKYGG